jgi:hypothetical protein
VSFWDTLELSESQLELHERDAAEAREWDALYGLCALCQLERPNVLLGVCGPCSPESAS